MVSTAEILVQKFGGSSLASMDQLRRVADVVQDAHRGPDAVVVVVSARGDTTDDLLRLAAQVMPPGSGRETDQLLATGEIVSAALLAMELRTRGVPAVSLTGGQAGIIVTGEHGAGIIDRIDTSVMLAMLADGEVPVVAGFQGVDAEGNTRTLGRGGSDTTAVALAAEFGARRCEIYTDVDGIYTADPRLVPGARLLPAVPAPVMAEMSFAGAKVMYSRATELAGLRGVDVHVRSSITRQPGTTVIAATGGALENRGAVMAITHEQAVARVLVQADDDLARDVFLVLARLRTPVDLVARSGRDEPEFRMGFTIPSASLVSVVPPLRAMAAPRGGRVDVTEDVGKISMVGTGLLNRPEFVTRMLTALDEAGIVTSWVSATQLRTSMTVPSTRVAEAVTLLHNEFGLEHSDFDLNSMAAAQGGNAGD
jgi:aspartate kinase